MAGWLQISQTVTSWCAWLERTSTVPRQEREPKHLKRARPGGAGEIPLLLKASGKTSSLKIPGLYFSITLTI